MLVRKLCFFILIILDSARSQSNNKHFWKNNSPINKKGENEKESSKNIPFQRYSHSQEIEDPEDFEIQPSEEATNTTKKERNENIKCPVNQSSYSITDLKEIVNFIVDSKLKTTESINTSYYLHAITVRDKYTKRLEEFQKKIEGRPEHLKHILQDVAKSRVEIENIVEKIASEVEEYHENADIYDYKIDRANKTLENVHKIKQICKFSCEDQHFIESRKKIKKLKSETKSMINAEQSYCSEFEDIRRTVIHKLSDFQRTYEQKLQEDIDHDDKEYERKTEHFLKTLKDAAMKNFGITMYNILSLQDECHHVLQELINNNVSEALSNIQKCSYLIEIKLTNIKDKLESYKEYCMNCKQMSFVRRQRRQTLSYKEGRLSLKQEADENRLDYLINSKIAEITRVIDDNYAVIFDELNEKLNSTKFIEIYLAGLTPIQDEIANLTQIEIERLDRLKDRIPKSSFDRIMTLQYTFTQIMETLSNDDLLHIPKLMH